MKKYLALLLALILCLSVTACGGGSGESSNAQPLSEKETKEMLTNADSFKGRTVEKLPVKVFNVISKESGDYQYQGWADSEQNNSVLLVSDEDPNIDSDDYILLTGTVVREHKGENAFGGTITAPIIQVTEIQKADATIFNPSKKTIEANQTLEQHGLTMTLQKVEIADKSTRIYLKMVNNSGDTISIYSFNSYILQGSTQLDESDMSYDENTLKSEMVNGSEQSGLLSFETADKDGGPLKIVLDVSSDDWDIRFSEFIFDIALN